ncbi:SDR family oxidoreductase [Lysobacter solisilvae]|uniref:SDR family oxidoreductase n=1 Tax=Agrilutibacter solisilvae TaxID=2763317 RepID=A0A974Y1Z3_9GAMM|nr:SDR family oxidoreductase [Lysobacter solisilvae]
MPAWSDQSPRPGRAPCASQRGRIRSNSRRRPKQIDWRRSAIEPLESIQRRLRCGEPNEIADVVLWLSSDAASYVTGQPTSVDGGFIMRST